MKVILKKDVKKLGKTHDVVTVSDGYATNYLIPKQLAIVYNEQGKKELQKELANLEAIEDSKRKDASLLKNKLEAMNLTFSLKINHDNGSVYGHISNKVLIEAINKNEKLIEKHMLAEPYKLTIGPSTIIVNLYKEITAQIKVNVLAE